MKNKELELGKKKHESVAGMLLYAQTEEDGNFEKTYKMSGNEICVKTLDLNAEFEDIKDQLNSIAESIDDFRFVHSALGFY